MEVVEEILGPAQEELPTTSQVKSPSDSENSSSDGSENDDLGFTDEFGIFKKKKSDRTKRATRRHISKLSASLKGLMGEANLRYARGDVETAKRMCFEVMRQVPDAYEPYITLAQIYENTDLTKYEGYLSIAGCLHTYDAEICCRLAELNTQNGKIKEAISYYSRALRIKPKNIENHLRRLELVESLGDSKFALSCKKHMANKLPRSQYQKIIQLSMEVTKQYHEEKNYIKALEALEVPFKRVPKKVTQDLVNMMLELLLLAERFTECLDVFIQHCNFTFEITVDTDSKIIVNSYVMSPSTQIDLKVKFIVCLIKLKSLHLVPPLIDAMVSEEDVEVVGDLFLDVAEDLMAVELHAEALKLLIPLIKSKAYSLAAVWLKYADCLSYCNMLEQAVEAYFTVMTMAPQHVEVLYPLAMALLKLDKKAEALEVLSQDLSANKLDVAVLIERMKLLKQINAMEEYWKCTEILFSRHCLVIKYLEEIPFVTAAYSYNEKVKKMQKTRMFRNDLTPVETQFESIREPPVEDEYQLFREILQFACDTKQFSHMEMVVFLGMSSKKFAPYWRDIHIAAFFACLYNNDSFHSYNLMRNVVFNQPDNNLAWNLFNVLLQTPDDVRYAKFISRFQEKLPNCYSLQVIDANCALAVGNYNLALKFYMKEASKNMTPYLAFMLGLIVLQSCSKRKPVPENKKQLTEITSYLFMYYARNRSKDAQQEVYYNMGRMYHQLGVMYLAEKCYLNVLACKEMENPDILDLKYEAAYNLHLIYRSSGNLIAARNVLMKHVVI